MYYTKYGGKKKVSLFSEIDSEVYEMKKKRNEPTKQTDNQMFTNFHIEKKTM